MDYRKLTKHLIARVHEWLHADRQLEREHAQRDLITACRKGDRWGWLRAMGRLKRL